MNGKSFGRGKFLLYVSFRFNFNINKNVRYRYKSVDCIKRNIYKSVYLFVTLLIDERSHIKNLPF